MAIPTYYWRMIHEWPSYIKDTELSYIKDTELRYMKDTELSYMKVSTTSSATKLMFYLACT